MQCGDEFGWVHVQTARGAGWRARRIVHVRERGQFQLGRIGLQVTEGYQGGDIQKQRELWDLGKSPQLDMQILEYQLIFEDLKALGIDGIPWAKGEKLWKVYKIFLCTLSHLIFITPMWGREERFSLSSCKEKIRTQREDRCLRP